MPNNNYVRGRKFEYRARAQLLGQGHEVFRMAGSHSCADLISFHRGRTFFVQCKTDGKFPLKEKQKLYATAHKCGATPILAFRDGRGIAMREVEAC